jgi:menaquinone-dependent protoporphyrinogen oxidase
MKALIVYGTRYGTTAGTSQVIAETLRQEGFEVEVVDAKKAGVHSVNDYDLVIVGSGIQMGKWTSEPESFLRKYQMELSRKKVAIFVSCGSANPLSEGEQRKKEVDEGKRKYLDEIAIKYNLKPIALGFFGGCYDFNKMSWFFRKTLSSIKPKLEDAGYKGSRNGVYDLRDLNGIRNWAEEVAKAVSS